MSTPASDSASAETIVLIHGMWMTPLSWEHWASATAIVATRCIAPAWPGLDRRTERAAPRSRAAQGPQHQGRSSTTTTRSSAGSTGRRSSSATRSAVSSRSSCSTAGSAPPASRSAPARPRACSSCRSRRSGPPGRARNPANLNKETPLTPEQFHWCFTNSLSREAVGHGLRALLHPGRARPFFQAGLANFNPNAETKVNYKNPARRAAAAGHRRGGPHLPAVGEQGELQAQRKAPVRHRAQGVPGPVRTSRARTAGRRSPTTCSSGPPSTPTRAAQPAPPRRGVHRAELGRLKRRRGRTRSRA